MEVRFFCIQYSAAKKFFVCHSSQIAIVMAHINLSENTKLENEKKPIPEEDAKPEKAERREFMIKVGSVCLGGAVAIPPIAAGVAVLMDPLRRKQGDTDFTRVTLLDALPEDGTPKKFTIYADKQDAWNKFPNTAIGAIYLCRKSDGKVDAYNVVCPHLGCAVVFRESERDYYCPCHNSAFDLETGTQAPDSPSARGLDSLEVRLENEGEVWVKFQNFQPGIADKKAIA